MHYVYVLWSKVDKKFYIGYTSNLERRLQEHHCGKCHTTHRMTTPELIFYEAYLAETDARSRELYFKTSKGKKTLRLMLKNSLE